MPRRVRKNSISTSSLSTHSVLKQKLISTKITSIKRVEDVIPRIQMTFKNGLKYTLKEDGMYPWRDFWRIWQYANEGDDITLVTYDSTIIAVEYHCK